jgi:arylsulfatase A-like enzyme
VTSATGKRPLDLVRRLTDLLWIEEKVVWSAALATILLFSLVDLPFSVARVAGPYALFLGRIAAIVVVIVAVHRLGLHLLGRSAHRFTAEDVWWFLRTLAFYLVALTTYTNLKTHTLLLHPRVFDAALERLDRWLFLGHSPTELALGMSPDATVSSALDTAYTFAWVPLAIIFGVVFSQAGGPGFRRLARVISLNYLLGALLYVALPAVGPAFAERELYEPLRQSRSYLIQSALINVHNQIVAAPAEFLVPAFMGIAAFPSLHVSHIYLPLLVARRRARWLLVAFVPAFVAVCLSTVYFGWHWVVDIPAGMATIHLCYWLARRLERLEEAAGERRAQRRAPDGGAGAEPLRPSAGTAPQPLGQWPVIAVLGALHLAGLFIAFALLSPEAPLTWGSGAALVFFLFFWVLLEVCLVTGLVGLTEALAGRRAPTPRGIPPRLAWLDAAKATALGLGFTLGVASLLKLKVTGSHLGDLDLRFLFGNLRQIAGESSGAELGLALVMLVLWALTAVALFRGFAARRRDPAPLPLRHLMLLAVLALLGAAYPVYRYDEARFMAPRVVPELGWLVPAPAPAAIAVAAGEPVALDGPAIEPWEPPRPAGKAPNVLLLMLESVPAQVLDWPEAERAIPNLLSLARQSLTFSRAYAPSVHSDYAQMAILSSLHPRKFERHDYYGELEYPRTLLWDLLAPAGWRTAAFSCQNEAWGNMIAYLRTLNLGSLRHSVDWPGAPRKGRGSETKVFEPTVVGAWQEWLDALPAGDDAPWLAYLNFQATHFPYEIPINAPQPFQPADLDFPATFLQYPRDKVPVMRNRFLNALSYSDHYLGEIVRTLEERGAFEDTVLLVVSDHGEAFYEHGQPTHGTQLYEEQVRSLLVARLPGRAPRAIEEPVSLLDPVPSLARELGLPAHGNLQGRDDIFEPSYSARGRAFHFTIQGLTFEDAILLDDWKYVFNWRTGAERLYDLSRDPGELEDVSREHPERARALAVELGRFLARQLAYYARAGWESGLYPARLH